MGKKKKINPIHSTFIISIIIIIILVIIIKKIFWKKEEKIKKDQTSIKEKKKRRDYSDQILSKAPQKNQKNISKYIIDK